MKKVKDVVTKKIRSFTFSEFDDASIWCFYQPKMPKKVKKLHEKK